MRNHWDIYKGCKKTHINSNKKVALPYVLIYFLITKRYKVAILYCSENN